MSSFSRNENKNLFTLKWKILYASSQTLDTQPKQETQEQCCHLKK